MKPVVIRRPREENRVVSGRPALIRQRDLKQALAAAKKAGASEVRVQYSGGVSVVIPLRPADKDEQPDTKDEQVIL